VYQNPLTFVHVTVYLAIDYRVQHRLYASKGSTLTQVSCPVMEVDSPIGKLELVSLSVSPQLINIASVTNMSLVIKHSDNNVVFLLPPAMLPKFPTCFRYVPPFFGKFHCLLVFRICTPFDARTSLCSAFGGSSLSISASTLGDPPLAFAFVVSPSGPVPCSQD